MARATLPPPLRSEWRSRTIASQPRRPRAARRRAGRGSVERPEPGRPSEG